MASLTTASSSSPTLTSIRERTRNAIAHHRAWRQPVLAAPDVRRTYAGTSASVAAGARHPPGPLQSSSSVAPSNPTTSSSASPCSVSLAPLNLRKNSSQEGSTGSNPRSQSCQTPSPEEAVYRAIEAEEQQERQQSRAIPQRQSYPQHYDHERSQQEYQQFSNDSSMNDISMENHLQQLEQQFGVSVRSSFESSAERTPATATPAPRKVDNKTQGSNDTGNESFRPRTMESTQMPLSNVVANPLVMDFRDPPQTLTKQQHYEQKLRDHAAKVKQQQQQQNHGLIYRDDGSVMTGMSQQELIRKKTRDTMRRSGSSSKRKNNSGSGKRSRNIVQLPANLLSLQPSVRISSPQKRHPQHQYYMAHSSVDGNQTDEEEKKIASRLASLRWNSNSRTSSARSGELPSNHSPNNNSNEEELDSFSTTAETTNASGESTPSPTTNARGLYSNNESYGPIDTSVTSESASRWMMGTSATTMPSGVVASSSRTVEWHPPNSQEDAWLDEEVNPGNHSTINNLSNEEPVYPTLSRNFEHAEIQRDEDCEESSEVNRINDRASDGDNIEMESSGFKSARRGVRFAETFDQNYSSTVSGGDEWSEVPWDQKNDQMGTQRSPASVLEAIAEPMGNERESEHDTCANLRPKSILRRSRFKPNSTTASRHLVNDFHFSDYESEHLIHGGNPMDKQRQTFVASRGMVAVKQTENARYEQTDQDKPRNAPSLRKARLAKSRDVNSSLDMSPPRHNALITDKEGLELSPIAQSSISEVSSSQQKQMNLNSNVPGHPAEKHLRGKLAAVREMRGGEIAEQVMEEVQYPDPPLEIDVRNFQDYVLDL